MEPPSPDILIVCTANEARSPLLAGLLDAALHQQLGSHQLWVGSAGVHARQGAAAAEGSRRAAAERGVDLDHHRATPLRFTDTRRCVLVITMTRRQRRLVPQQTGIASTQVFTMRELLEDLPPSDTLEPRDDDTPRRALERVVDAAHRNRRRTAGRRWDVPDPIGKGAEVYEQLADELSTAARAIAASIGAAWRPTAPRED